MFLTSKTYIALDVSLPGAENNGVMVSLQIISLSINKDIIYFLVAKNMICTVFQEGLENKAQQISPENKFTKLPHFRLSNTGHLKSLI